MKFLRHSFEVDTYGEALRVDFNALIASATSPSLEPFLQVILTVPVEWFEATTRLEGPSAMGRRRWWRRCRRGAATTYQRYARMRSWRHVSCWLRSTCSGCN